MDQSLQKWLKDHQIKYIKYTHPPVYTVLEAKKHCGHIPGAHVKNLFLRVDSSDEFYLVTFPSEERLDIDRLQERLGVEKIRFAKEKHLKNYLGLTPGSVSPLGLINDKRKKVNFLIDEKLWNAESIVIHPNINTESLLIHQESFRRFLRESGNKFEVTYLKFE